MVLLSRRRWSVTETKTYSNISELVLNIMLIAFFFIATYFKSHISELQNDNGTQTLILVKTYLQHYSM